MKLWKLGLFALFGGAIYQVFLLLPAEAVWLHGLVALLASVVLSMLMTSFLIGKHRD